MNRLSRYLLVLLVFGLLAVCSCTTAQVSTTAGFTPITLTDQLGRTVTIDKVPQRIISLAPSNTEILFALGLGDRVVGVTDYCDYPPEAKNKLSVGDYSQPNIEQIIALSPDLILADSIHDFYGIIPQLEANDLTVFGIYPKNLDDTLQAITLIGKITGVEEAATNLVSQMQGQIDAVTDKTKGLTSEQKPSVYYIVWHEPIMIVGTARPEDEFINLAGGINLGGTREDYYDISLEAIIEANPDVIIVSSDMATDATLKYVLAESRLAGTSALRNNRVYGVDTNLSGRTGPRIVLGLLAFAECIHPELFPKE